MKKKKLIWILQKNQINDISEDNNGIDTSINDENSSNKDSSKINLVSNKIIISTDINNNEENLNHENSNIIIASLSLSSISLNLEEENIIYNITGENNQKIYHKIKEMIMNYMSILSKKEKIIIEGKDNFIYEITTTENDKDYLEEKSTNNNKNNDNLSETSKSNKASKVSKIDLGECENLLKDTYHLDRNISLIIVKFEKITNDSSEKTLLYDVYDPLNKTKLDLSICDKIPIIIYTPVELSEELLNLYNQLKDMGYDLFDIESDFYKDICVPFTSPEGTDVTLADRKNYYFNNNETLCQPNCKFSGYSVETKLLKCKCDITNSDIETTIIKKKLTKETAYESFYDTLKFSNYKVLWCYKLAFHINSVTINKGSIIAIIYFSFYLIFLILYCIQGIKQLKIEFARNIFITRKNTAECLIKDDMNKIDEKNISSGKKEFKRNDFRRRSTKKYLDKDFPPKRKSSLKKHSFIKRQSTQKVKINNNFNSNKKLLVTNKISSKNKILETYVEDQVKAEQNLDNETKENKEEKKLDDYELNNLEFEEALKLDKRSFINTYWSTIRREHLIIFTFFVRDDYNLVFVKFSRLIFLICTDMAVNVFFFSDETMHKMHLDYGKYDFIQQIPQIVISTVVSQILEVFLCFLSMTDKHFYEIKELKYEDRYYVFHIIKCIKIKLTFYFITTFLLFAFYWYSIACFCAVYPNTQMAFIKDSISSFALGLLYPFLLYLFPTIFRIISLRATKSNLSCLYAFSDIIPFF